MSDYTLLLIAPENTEYSALPEDIQSILVDLKTIYPPGGICPNTQIQNGYKLLHTVIETDAQDVDLMLETLIALYELDWTIAALRHTHTTSYLDEEGNSIEELEWLIQPSESILTYLPPIVEYDEEGNIISSVQATDLSGVHIYQGHAGWSI